jgi:uncharacterized protein YhaN
LARPRASLRSAVKQSLKALDELRSTLSAELEGRIAKMERDKLLFADEVSAVVAALDLNDVPGDVRQRVDAIEERVARAGENARRRAEKADALREANGGLKAITEELEINTRQASVMTAFFAVGTLADVAVKLEDCKRRDALRRRSRAKINRCRQRRRLAEAARLSSSELTCVLPRVAALKARTPLATRRMRPWRSCDAQAPGGIGDGGRAARKSGAPFDSQRRSSISDLRTGIPARRAFGTATGTAAR